MTRYFVFQTDDPTKAENCTTRWPDSIQCSIPVSGIRNGMYINLMVMTTESENDLDEWFNENRDKLSEVTLDEFESMVFEIVPIGTVLEFDHLNENIKKRVTGFSIEQGLILEDVTE